MRKALLVNSLGLTAIVTLIPKYVGLALLGLTGLLGQY